MSEETTSNQDPSTNTVAIEPEVISIIEPEIEPEPIIDRIETPQESTNEPKSEPEIIEKFGEIVTDNGIFDFMTIERTIELYKRIHSQGPPELEWKFHGRRQPGEQERDDVKDTNKVDKDEIQNNENQQDQTVNTEFDFDEELSDLQFGTSIVDESLSLKRRPEQGSDKKTNLSDIMSDIMKGSLAETSE